MSLFGLCHGLGRTICWGLFLTSSMDERIQLCSGRGRLPIWRCVTLCHLPSQCQRLSSGLSFLYRRSLNGSANWPGQRSVLVSLLAAMEKWSWLEKNWSWTIIFFQLWHGCGHSTFMLVNHRQFGGPSETMNRKGPRAVQTVCVLLTYLFMFHFLYPCNPLVLTCVLWTCICLWLLILQELLDSIPQYVITYHIPQYVITCTREVALKDKTEKVKKLMNVFKDNKNKIKI